MQRPGLIKSKTALIKFRNMNQIRAFIKILIKAQTGLLKKLISENRKYSSSFGGEFLWINIKQGSYFEKCYLLMMF